MAITTNTSNLLFEREGYSFLQIGKDRIESEISLEQFQKSKHQKIKDAWGTLGWADDRPMAVEGELTFSREGNQEHRGVTQEIAELLHIQNIEIDNVSQIKERFIDLASLNILNFPESISDEREIQLRFNLFLEKDEGALVYLQENPLDDYNSEDSVVHLITPESTAKDFNQNRYTLKYIFTYLNEKVPNYDSEKVFLNEDNTESKTVLKVLTFKRSESDITSYTKSAAKNLNGLATNLAHKGLHKLGEKKYGIYKFDGVSVNGNGGTFQEVDNTTVTINRQLKTLLLIHGTFSSVEGSFGKLTETYTEQQSFLQQLLIDGVYDQILAFNHPTASHSIDDNIHALLSRLGDAPFINPIDVITTSRGVLIAESLSAHPLAYRIFRINKILSFAPAHGSDLLKLAKGLDRFLSLLKKTTSKTGWGYVLALAQFSVNAIRTQPGLEVMMPGSKSLEKILQSNPIEEIRLKAMVGDFHRCLVDNWGLRVLAMGADGLSKLVFRSENDWVIGCPEQRRQLAGPNARYESNFEYYCIHGKQFDPKHTKDKNKNDIDVREEIVRFLN